MKYATGNRGWRSCFASRCASPDFSDDVPGWSEIGSTWHTGLIDEFTGGTRSGAADASQRSVRAATDLIVNSFWGFET